MNVQRFDRKIPTCRHFSGQLIINITDKYCQNKFQVSKICNFNIIMKVGSKFVKNPVLK